MAVQEEILWGTGYSSGSYVRIYGANWFSQVFTVPDGNHILGAFYAWVAKSQSGSSFSADLDIYVADGNGEPTGGSLWNGPLLSAIPGTTPTKLGWLTLDSLNLSPGDYVLVVDNSSGSETTDELYWYYTGAGDAVGRCNSSSDSGSNWSQLGTDIMNITDVTGRIGRLDRSVSDSISIDDHFLAVDPEPSGDGGGGGPRIACLGDSSSHSGSIITTNTDGTVHAGGIDVAVNGASHSCPIEGHGVTSITAITTITNVNGKLILTKGAVAGCGAKIRPPDRKVYVE